MLNFNLPGSGTLDIVGRYCEPQSDGRDDKGRPAKNTLQILVHGPS